MVIGKPARLLDLSHLTLKYVMHPTGKKAPPLRSYRDLKVWQFSMDLVVEGYHITEDFPTQERYGLVAQTRRAAVSIPCNIAEGYGRYHRGDYVRHLSIASGSLKELETQVLIANRLGMVGATTLERFLARTGQLGRMLGSLMRKLKRRQN
jgi:four helix bundle protein